MRSFPRNASTCKETFKNTSVTAQPTLHLTHNFNTLSLPSIHAKDKCSILILKLVDKYAAFAFEQFRPFSDFFSQQSPYSYEVRPIQIIIGSTAYVYLSIQFDPLQCLCPPHIHHNSVYPQIRWLPQLFQRKLLLK